MTDWQADRLVMLVRQRATVTLDGRLAGRQAGNVTVRQRAVVIPGDRLVDRSRLSGNAIVRQRAIVILGGRLAGRQAGNVSQVESNSYLW